MPAPARIKFAERIGEVQQLHALCTPATADIREQRANRDRDNALLRAAHVLLCSHVEGFFEDIVSDAIDAYDRLSQSVGNIPDEIRARQIMKLDSRWEHNDRDKRWRDIQQCAAHPLMTAGAIVNHGCLDAAIHTEGFANPGTNEITDLFRSIGIADIWDRFSAIEQDRLFKDEINAIVHRRNQIAHGKLNATITLADSTLYVLRIERVAEVIEQVVTHDIEQRLQIVNCWGQLERWVAPQLVVPPNPALR